MSLAHTDSSISPTTRLNRDTIPITKAPIRIVHLGLGAFHRSHQAWYTHRAGDAADWGIASFTGRRPDAAVPLTEQDGLYTVIERSNSGDSFEVVGSIVEACDGTDVERLTALLSSPAVAIVTLTITEAAYGKTDCPTNALSRLVLALDARRLSRAGPLAVVCCDNLADNGTVTRNEVLSLAKTYEVELTTWIKENVSFVNTSVDRITPRTTNTDRNVVATACSYRDDSPVVTEPFHNWILSGQFPSGRPRWEDAGAIFVDAIEPYENRKLWLLNGAHSLLAYVGLLRGHRTVAQSLADETCLRAVEAFWDEASAHLSDVELRIQDYRTALLERFSNSRIAHNLIQIAMDGSTKLRMRAIPVLRAERSAGRSGAGAALMIAAWISFAANADQLQDPHADDITAFNRLTSRARVQAMLAMLDPELSTDADLVDVLRCQADALIPSSALSRKEIV